MAIERADVETMAYRMSSRSDVPWHNLGKPITHDAEPEEMGREADLLWTVSKRRNIVLGTLDGLPEGVSLAEYVVGGGKLLSVNDFFTLVRDSDNKILGPAGKDCLPTQNITLFKFLKKFTDAGKMTMETAGALQGGRQVWVLAKLKMRLTLPGGDIVEGYLLISSPHIWGKSLVIKFVTIRVICANTFALAMRETTYGKGFRMPHIREFDDETVQAEAEATLGLATEMFDSFKEKAELLASASVDTDVQVRYIADVLQPEIVKAHLGMDFYDKYPANERAKILVDPSSPKFDPQSLNRTAFSVFTQLAKQPGADMESSSGTLWGAFNAVTYHADHLAGRNRDNALTSAWFGANAVTKARAMDRAVLLAKAL